MLLAAICLTILFGCATQPEIETQPSKIETQPPEIETQPLIEVSVIPSAIVIGNEEKSYVRAIASKVNTLIGAENLVYTAENAPDADVRIYIGNPKELQLGSLVEEAPFYDYLVTVREGDLYILSYNDTKLEEVAMVVLKEINGWYSDKTIVVPDDYELVSNLSEVFLYNDIPLINGSKQVTAHDYDNGHSVLAMEDGLGKR